MAEQFSADHSRVVRALAGEEVPGGRPIVGLVELGEPLRDLDSDQPAVRVGHTSPHSASLTVLDPAVEFSGFSNALCLDLQRLRDEQDESARVHEFTAVVLLERELLESVVDGIRGETLRVDLIEEVLTGAVFSDEEAEDVPVGTFHRAIAETLREGRHVGEVTGQIELPRVAELASVLGDADLDLGLFERVSLVLFTLEHQVELSVPEEITELLGPEVRHLGLIGEGLVFLDGVLLCLDRLDLEALAEQQGEVRGRHGLLESILGRSAGDSFVEQLGSLEHLTLEVGRCAEASFCKQIDIHSYSL